MTPRKFNTFYKGRTEKTFLTQKKYGRTKAIAYYPFQDTEDINLEPITLRRIMKQVQVELINSVEFCGQFGVKSYPVGIHSLDSDLARLLIRVRSARYVLPHKEVPAAKQSKH